MKGTTIKILIAGARYTGKGQVGRAWGKTDADVPTLQPVLLYDRHVACSGVDYRVVAWVLSFDPEFEDLRSCFYKDADGLIYTHSIATKYADSIDKLDGYAKELKQVLIKMPPAVLLGFILDDSKPASQAVRDKARKWAQARKLKVFEAHFMDKAQFSATVDQAFDLLLDAIIPKGKT